MGIVPLRSTTRDATREATLRVFPVPLGSTGATPLTVSLVHGRATRRDAECRSPARIAAEGSSRKRAIPAIAGDRGRASSRLALSCLRSASACARAVYFCETPEFGGRPRAGEADCTSLKNSPHECQSRFRPWCERRPE